MIGGSRFAAVLSLVWLLVGLTGAPVYAQPQPARIALLIGNQGYDRSVGELKNPHNDIAVVGEALRKQGFTVLPPVKDARRSTILGAVRDLVRQLNTAGTGAIGFLYYSGHGAAESDTGFNYLIPVDAKEPGSATFWDDSLKLDDILKLLDGARGAAKFIVFDACRNELRVPAKSTTKGLLPVAEQQGMFIAYASAPGRTASDAGTTSGPYAAALAAELGKGGQDHLNLFQNVKEAVIAKTGGVQQPWFMDGLVRRIYPTGVPQAVTPAPSLPPPERPSTLQGASISIRPATGNDWDRWIANKIADDMEAQGYKIIRSSANSADLIFTLRLVVNFGEWLPPARGESIGRVTRTGELATRCTATSPTFSCPGIESPIRHESQGRGDSSQDSQLLNSIASVWRSFLAVN